MFGTSIHWTTFFYLLLDSIIVLFTLYQTIRLKCASLRRYFYLGLLYVAYNFTGGFLPMKSFPGPMILQYIITYGTAISLCIYIVYYLYKEYDIEVLKYKYSIRNLTLLTTLCFATLYLTTYYLTDSLLYSRLLFNITISIAAIIFIIIFQRRIIALDIPNPFIARRNKL